VIPIPRPALLLSALAWLPSAVVGQGAIEVPDTLACDCRLELNHVAALADPDGRAGLSEPLVVHRTAGGAYLVVPLSDQGALLAFDGAGGFIRRIGRSGQGPREFRGILAVSRGQGDSTLVLDALNSRLAVLDGELGIARMARLPVRGGWFGLVEGGPLLVLEGIPRVGGAHDRVRILDGELVEVGSFLRQARSAADPVDALRRRMAVSRRGTVAVAHHDSYVVEIWNSSGEHRATLLRRPGWFPPGTEGEPDPRGAPPPRLETPAFHAEGGLLWTVAHVADPEWASALGPGLDLYRRPTTRVPEGSNDRYRDSVVELLDPERGLLLGSLRVDPQVTFISEDGFAASYRQDDAGNPLVDIWQFTLRGREEGSRR
jgi:hypothetical protein